MWLGRDFYYEFLMCDLFSRIFLNKSICRWLLTTQLSTPVVSLREKNSRRIMLRRRSIVTSFYNDRLANFILSVMLYGLQKSIYDRNIRILMMPYSHAASTRHTNNLFFVCLLLCLFKINILHHHPSSSSSSSLLSSLFSLRASWHNLQINLPCKQLRDALV